MAKRKWRKLKRIEFCGVAWKIKWHKNKGGAYVNSNKRTIGVGCERLNLDPDYVYHLLMHEISEAIHMYLGTRYDDYSVDGNYKFFMDHKEFECHIAILSKTMLKFAR